MTDDTIDRLTRRQTEIGRGPGRWGGAGLARSCELAAGESPVDGGPELLHRLSQLCTDAARPLHDAREALADLRATDLGGVWTGAAHNAAADAVTALHEDVTRACRNVGELGEQLRAYAERLAPARRTDEAGRADLLTAGAYPYPSGHDGEALRAVHQLALDGVDARLAAHVEARANAADLTAGLHDIATQARGRVLGTGPLTAVDAVALTRGGILTAAMQRRAGAALSALRDADRDRMVELLARCTSPEQRAYLLKALAAGYPIDDVTGFAALIAGRDPDWLDQHLSPLSLDGEPGAGKQVNAFAGALWAQGDLPTCVAASTITGRAEVDPLYALGLTTGGHPGDPALDNPVAFADRLRAEQTGVYDAERDRRDWWHRHVGNAPGLSNAESREIAQEQLTPRTGAGYTNVPMAGAAGRADAVAAVERAVDDGYPVPLTVREDGRGHQLLVIGHHEDQLELYNPWGYTYWVAERDFVAGDVDDVDPAIPDRPVSIRLPRETSP